MKPEVGVSANEDWPRAGGLTLLLVDLGIGDSPNDHGTVDAAGAVTLL